MRSSAQMISYELALGLSTVGVLLLAGSLSLLDIVRAQQGWYHLGPVPFPRWYVFTQPVAFAIFVVCAFAETNRAPFDLPEGESELTGGFHTEYASMKWAMFFLGEYMNIITISAITVTLFLGGWGGPWLPQSLQFVWFFVKLFAMIFLFMWVRWTFPRLRYDQLMSFGWKVLLPVALLNVLATGAAVYWVGNR
jgi:NADH-quinone oxidoreductase subunit H